MGHLPRLNIFLSSKCYLPLRMEEESPDRAVSPQQAVQAWIEMLEKLSPAAASLRSIGFPQTFPSEIEKSLHGQSFSGISCRLCVTLFLRSTFQCRIAAALVT
jgi:hypothetical protein